MRVGNLIDLLKRFDSEAQVRLAVGWSGRVIETFDQVSVADSGNGPALIVRPESRSSCVYAGCGMEQLVHGIPELDLGRYATQEETAKVRDYYVLSQGLKERLSFPDFDYEHWIPPRTVSGEYNPHIAKILREKLLKE